MQSTVNSAGTGTAQGREVGSIENRRALFSVGIGTSRYWILRIVFRIPYSHKPHMENHHRIHRTHPIFNQASSSTRHLYLNPQYPFTSLNPTRNPSSSSTVDTRFLIRQGLPGDKGVDIGRSL
jgi:hypothetical protein